MAHDWTQQLGRTLAARTAGTRAEWEARPAAVLVPLLQKDGAWQLLLTQRTHTVESHKGQVAFPGGRVDPEDASRVETALRETEEEIGLPRQQVRVLGQLDELLTVTQYRVTPIVGVIPWPWAWRLSTAELSEVFTVPVRWLADPANRHVELREPYVPGPKIEVYYFYYEAYTIWGATARIIQNFVDIAQPLLAAL
ncbi:MAG: CoA pyrophosphatase [Anaerolineales bacterium]|nr:CoA pyrophosphatase [Anaerolineales bacterium]